MSVEERQAMIATSAIPLFIEHGGSLTTRQIADHLQIAEGTIFRAFGDKDTLVRAVVDAFFDQTQQTVTPELDQPGLSLAQKLHIVIRAARVRTRGVFAMLSLLDPAEAHEYMKQRHGGYFEEIATGTFAADVAELNVSPERLGALIRLLVIAASAPPMDGGAALTDEELVAFALYGIAGRPPHDDAAHAAVRKN